MFHFLNVKIVVRFVSIYFKLRFDFNNTQCEAVDRKFYFCVIRYYFRNFE